MAQQKGMKRAVKVADRARKKRARLKAGNIRRVEREAELAAAEEAKEAQKAKKSK